MEAVLRTGKKIKGRLAEILVKRDRATPLEFIPEPEEVLEAEQEVVPEVKPKKRSPKKSKK